MRPPKSALVGQKPYVRAGTKEVSTGVAIDNSGGSAQARTLRCWTELPLLLRLSFRILRATLRHTYQLYPSCLSAITNTGAI